MEEVLGEKDALLVIHKSLDLGSDNKGSLESIRSVGGVVSMPEIRASSLVHLKKEHP